MAKERQAPKRLGKLNRRGVPILALIITILVGALTFLSSLFGEGKVYTWLLNAAGLTGFLTWLGIAISHYRFRKAWVAQGKDLSQLPYRARWYPFGPLFTFILCAIIISAQNIQAFMGAHVDWYGVLVSYISIPLFLLLYLGYKWIKRTRLIQLEKVYLERTYVKRRR